MIEVPFKDEPCDVELPVSLILSGNGMRLAIYTKDGKSNSYSFQTNLLLMPNGEHLITLKGFGTATGSTECDNPSECHEECVPADEVGSPLERGDLD